MVGINLPILITFFRQYTDRDITSCIFTRSFYIPALQYSQKYLLIKELSYTEEIFYNIWMARQTLSTYLVGNWQMLYTPDEYSLSKKKKSELPQRSSRGINRFGASEWGLRPIIDRISRISLLAGEQRFLNSRRAVRRRTYKTKDSIGNWVDYTVDKKSRVSRERRFARETNPGPVAPSSLAATEELVRLFLLPFSSYLFSLLLRLFRRLSVFRFRQEAREDAVRSSSNGSGGPSTSKLVTFRWNCLPIPVGLFKRKVPNG